MGRYSIIISLFLSFTFFLSCKSQHKDSSVMESTLYNSALPIGGPFENGAFMYIDMPTHINAVDTSLAWESGAQKIHISGTIYKSDGLSPAKDVILYYYHTDSSGLYANHEDLNPAVARHGYLRGWVKSDANGNYSIYTIRPASYPNSEFAAHIHLSIKEPDLKNEYYIDAIEFDDDPLLTAEKRAQHKNRGGSGIISFTLDSNILEANHDIFLGKNIPNYPNQ